MLKKPRCKSSVSTGKYNGVLLLLGGYTSSLSHVIPPSCTCRNGLSKWLSGSTIKCSPSAHESGIDDMIEPLMRYQGYLEPLSFTSTTLKRWAPCSVTVYRPNSPSTSGTGTLDCADISCSRVSNPLAKAAVSKLKSSVIGAGIPPPKSKMLRLGNFCRSWA